MALWMVKAAGELGSQVPEHAEGAGIDDVNEPAHRAVRLTTVAHHTAEMACLAMPWIVEIVQDPAGFARQPVKSVLRPTPTIRRTCGALP